MIRPRMTYVPLEVADRFGDFIVRRDEQILDAVKARTRDYNVLSLLKLLYQLRGSPMTFSDLYSKSKIRMKKSFLSYLRLCLGHGLVCKEHVGHNVVYSLTEKGSLQLDLFMDKGA